jgi:serine/threonine protein kinase
LNPTAILLTREGTWLSDFGRGPPGAYNKYDDPENKHDLIARHYYAPEVADLLPSREASDVFSLGCIFLQISTLHQRGSLQHLEKLCLPGNGIGFRAGLHNLDTWVAESTEKTPVRSQILAMLSQDPNTRPTAHDLFTKFSAMNTWNPDDSPSLFKSCCRPTSQAKTYLGVPESRFTGEACDMSTGDSSRPAISVFDTVYEDGTVNPSTVGTSYGGTAPDSTEQDVVQDDDSGTAYSVDSHTEGSALEIIRFFAHRLVRETEANTNLANTETFQQDLDDIMKAFARRLHEESIDSFGWEASVAIHQNRE